MICLLQRRQILVLALICGSLAAFSAYWMNGELVKQGIFTTEPRHIPCLNDEIARRIATELQSQEFRDSLCVDGFSPEDLQVHANADGKWVETKLTLHCWGRASYSLLKFDRVFDASDAKARARNQRQLDRFEEKIKEISVRALAP